MCLADCGGLARSENEMETVTVRMARGERNIPWGFGVSEGSKGQAIIVNIVGGSLAERAGLRNGDEIEGIEGLNNLDINAVDRLLITSRDRIELIVHRHSSAVASANQMSRLQHQHQHQHQQQQQQDTRMWRPDIQESGDGQRPFKVSLEHNNDSRAPEGFNSSALPFQADPRVKHLQYNSPMGLYSNANVAESYNQQTTGYVEASAAPTYSHDQPSYLRSETLRLLKEQEAQRATPTLSQHPNPAGLPLCFVCNRKILGLLARAAGHDLHADCFQCATCGNSLKNVGHHFVESKFYCDIHGRQKKSLINGAASHPIIQSPPSKGHSNHSQEHVGSFYQPEILSRPIATQSINTHQINVNVQNPKTQGPISPAQRGIPTNSIFTGDQTTTTTKSAASSAEHFRNGNQSSSYNFNATHNAPSLPVQAPPPLPSQKSRIPLSVRDAVSPRSSKSPRQWPPSHNVSTNRYWIIDPVGKAKMEKCPEFDAVTLQDLIKVADSHSQFERSDDMLESASSQANVVVKTTTSNDDNSYIALASESMNHRSDPVVLPSLQISENNSNEADTSSIQNSIPVDLKVNEKEMSLQVTSKDIPQIQLTTADCENVLSEQPVIKCEASLKVITRQDSSTSPIPVIKFERSTPGKGRLASTSEYEKNFSKTIKIVTEEQSSTNYNNPTFVLNSSPRPFESSRNGGDGNKRVDFETEPKFINSDNRWNESDHIVDESDILTDNSRRSDESVDGSNMESKLTAAPYDGDVSEIGKSANTTLEDEQEEWMREEVEQAKREELEAYGSLATPSSLTINNSSKASSFVDTKNSLQNSFECIFNEEDDQRQRDLAIVAALHDRIHDIREMEDQDRLRAIECIERHQQDLENQQDQLSHLLHSAIQYLKTFETSEQEGALLESLNEAFETADSIKQNIQMPPVPPPRSMKTPPEPPVRRCFKILPSLSSDSLKPEVHEKSTDSFFTTGKEVAADLLISKLSEKLNEINDTPASSYQSNNEIYTKSITKASNPSPKTLNGNLSQQQTGGRTAFCESCKQQIRGAFVLASGLSWCPEHFICANSRCGRRLLECGFVEEGGQKYCEGCFETFIAPRCSKCTKPIISDCLNALQKKWHPTCFTCTHCQKPFGNSAFYLENGQAFCEGDWNMLFTTKCVNCKFAIEAGDRWVEALGSAFHSNCFNCSRCMINLEGESFFAKNGEPFCKLHA